MILLLIIAAIELALGYTSMAVWTLVFVLLTTYFNGEVPNERR